MKTLFDWIESKVLSMTKVYSPLPEGRFTLSVPDLTAPLL